MNITDLFDRILVLSGQFLIRRNKIELNKDKFRDLVEQALAAYSKATPHTERINLDLQASRSHTFTDANSPSIDGIDLGPPDFLSAVDPVDTFGTTIIAPFTKTGMGHPFPHGGNSHRSPWLEEKFQSPYDYNRRTKELVVASSSRYVVTACWYHKIYKVTTNGVDDYFIPTVDLFRDDVFVTLVQGMFLRGIGRSRRAFTLNDLPIAMDAAEITSEGDALVEKAEDKLENEEHEFYLAYN